MPNSAWHTLESMRITQWDVIEFIQTPFFSGCKLGSKWCTYFFGLNVARSLAQPSCPARCRQQDESPAAGSGAGYSQGLGFF